MSVSSYTMTCTTGDVFYDEETYQKDIRIKKAQSEVAEKIRSFAQKFDTMFNQINDKEQ